MAPQEAIDRLRKIPVRPNKCKHFDFVNADIFRQDENGLFAEYKPREIIKQPYEQMKLF